MFTEQKELDGTMSGHKLTYDVLVEEIGDARGCQLCENYGLRIEHTTPLGEVSVKEIPGITTSADKILALFERVARLEVTPATLADVVEDYVADDEA